MELVVLEEQPLPKMGWMVSSLCSVNMQEDIKNIRISGGNVKAIGTANGPGIGGGYGSDFDGLYITGGKVEAKGGANAPGIGTSIGYRNDYKLKNVQISGGDTVVIAIGDKIGRAHV